MRNLNNEYFIADEVVETRMQDLYFTAIVLILCRPLKLLNIFAKHFNYFLIYHDFGVHFERKQKHQWTVIVARQWQKHKAQLEALDVEKSNHSPTTTTMRKKIAHHRSFNISSINLYRYLSSYLFLVPFRLFFCLFVVATLYECVPLAHFWALEERWRQWKKDI